MDNTRNWPFEEELQVFWVPEKDKAPACPRGGSRTAAEQFVQRAIELWLICSVGIRRHIKCCFQAQVYTARCLKFLNIDIIAHFEPVYTWFEMHLGQSGHKRTALYTRVNNHRDVITQTHCLGGPGHIRQRAFCGVIVNVSWSVPSEDVIVAGCGGSNWPCPGWYQLPENPIQAYCSLKNISISSRLALV